MSLLDDHEMKFNAGVAFKALVNDDPVAMVRLKGWAREETDRIQWENKMRVAADAIKLIARKMDERPIRIPSDPRKTALNYAEFLEKVRTQCERGIAEVYDPALVERRKE